MPNNNQIMLVATGYYPDVADYLFSPDWQRDEPGFIIDRQGTIHGGQGDNHVIALENVGEVRKHNGQWVPVSHPDLTDLRIVPYEYCSCMKTFEMMGDRQLKTLHRLLKSLLSEHHIRFRYGNQLGRICPRAIDGEPGIYFASSFDAKRLDIHPQIELIMMIKALSS